MILCAGEALIDMIPDPSGAYKPHVGGAVLNTAVGLGRLGVPVGLVTGLSSDPFGQLIADHLHASHVKTDASVKSDRNTTLAFVHLEGGQATYSFYDENTATSAIEKGDMPSIPTDAEALFFGGISLCNAPLADSLVDMALSATDQIPVMVDPNIRPGFASDQFAYRTRLTRLIERADIVKLSDEDIDWLFPDGDLTNKARTVLSMGPKLLLLTEGSKGATAYRRQGSPVFVPAKKVSVVDTVGAGDTFNAGVLAALRAAGALNSAGLGTVSTDVLSGALGFAAQVAAVTVSRAGAQPPWASELNDHE